MGEAGTTRRRFQGRVVAITGAGSGIGRACALRLAEEGAAVVGLDLSAGPLDALAAEVATAGGRFAGVVGDVVDLAAIDAMIDRAVVGFGGLDGLVNNAGVGGPMKPFDAVEPEEFDAMVAVNLRSVWYGIKAARAPMAARGGGAIVNVASMAGIRPNRHHSPYGMTKAAVISLTHHAAMDYASAGIRVNCLCPGPVETPIFGQMERHLGAAGYEAARRRLLQRTLVNRFGTPEEQAAAVAFLLGPEAAFITGIALPVDGGWSISDGQTR
ncbi:MAG: SDR family NAD(P)-dependent oxidoreductase [Pseudomonadota bacterium]